MTETKRRVHSPGVGSASRSAGDTASSWVVDAYRQHYREIWALVGRLGVPAAHAEDVVQDVFVVLHRRREDFRNDSSIRTWLHGIALRVARRHRQRVRSRQTEPLPPQAPASGPSPEAWARGRAQLGRLDTLLAQLPADQREVFVLAEVAQLRAPEIAAVLGVKLNTVYSRLRLARGRMKEGLVKMRAAEEGGADGAT